MHRLHISGGFPLTNADKFWATVAVLVPLILHDKKQRRKIKQLKGVNRVLNRENAILATIFIASKRP